MSSEWKSSKSRNVHLTENTFEAKSKSDFERVKQKFDQINSGLEAEEVSFQPVDSIFQHQKPKPSHLKERSKLNKNELPYYQNHPIHKDQLKNLSNSNLDRNFNLDSLKISEDDDDEIGNIR